MRCTSADTYFQTYYLPRAETYFPGRLTLYTALLGAGYAGFDPLGFSDYYDIKWLQEAEIKHGRIAMLAAVGMVRGTYSYQSKDEDVAGFMELVQHGDRYRDKLTFSHLRCFDQ